jgi:protein tyrosine phosphatase
MKKNKMKKFLDLIKNNPNLTILIIMTISFFVGLYLKWVLKWDSVTTADLALLLGVITGSGITAFKITKTIKKRKKKKK